MNDMYEANTVIVVITLDYHLVLNTDEVIV
jgi:hypothetical protein